ncbi:MAG: cyclic nucleotide-binding domain-containing protein [Elusimicrobia bacterium]|nr:cyclic nucleotide-binding domain-containing protein [Elusimicrobiota bacterium]MBU2614603.1 cyclic nucleotide-binding domain-containing protein [Elusimicrobiota bacterium]
MALKPTLRNLFMDKEFTEKVNFLKNIPIFEGLSNSALGKITGIIYSKKYPADELIFEEGKVGKALFIIYDGEVAITKASNGAEAKVIATHQKGAFFGEMALLEELPRSATTKTTKETTLFLIYKVKFDWFIEKDPRVGLKIIHNIAKVLSARLRETSNFFSKTL